MTCPSVGVSNTTRRARERPNQLLHSFLSAMNITVVLQNGILRQVWENGVLRQTWTGTDRAGEARVGTMSRANKRPLAERDPNICFPPAKRVAKGEKPKRERTSAKGHFEKQPFEGRYEYICVKRPPWNKEGGESDGDGEEQEDAESDESKQVSMKPAS